MSSKASQLIVKPADKAQVSYVPSQLIKLLGGEALATVTLSNAPVGSDFVGIYQVANGFIEMYYNKSGHLFDPVQGIWNRTSQTRIEDIRVNPQFKVFCSLLEIHQALEQLPHILAHKTYQNEKYMADQLKAFNDKNTSDYMFCAVVLIASLGVAIHELMEAIL